MLLSTNFERLRIFQYAGFLSNTTKQYIFSCNIIWPVRYISIQNHGYLNYHWYFYRNATFATYWCNWAFCWYRVYIVKTIRGEVIISQLDEKWLRTCRINHLTYWFLAPNHVGFVKDRFLTTSLLVHLTFVSIPRTIEAFQHPLTQWTIS